jgi:hypothetical protein
MIIRINSVIFTHFLNLLAHQERSKVAEMGLSITK